MSATRVLGPKRQETRYPVWTVWTARACRSRSRLPLTLALAAHARACRSRSRLPLTLALAAHAHACRSRSRLPLTLTLALVAHTHARACRSRTRSLAAHAHELFRVRLLRQHLEGFFDALHSHKRQAMIVFQPAKVLLGQNASLKPQLRCFRKTQVSHVDRAHFTCQADLSKD